MKLNLKTGEKSWQTVLCCRRPNKAGCKKFQHTWYFYAHFPKVGKTKTKMDDLHQDSRAQTGLPTEYFVLCSGHFEASCFSKSVLSGTPVDFKRFYLEEGSAPSIDTKPKDSLNIDYSRNEGKAANQFFSQETFFGRFFGTLPRNVSIQNSSLPPPQKKTFLFGLGRLIRDMLPIFQDDRSTTLSMMMGLF